MVAVGAVTDSGDIAWFSNECGSVMNNCLVAPGDNIATTTNGGGWTYSGVDGTSFAAPIVAGTASLLFSTRPDLTGEQVSRMLLHSASDIEIPGTDQFTGRL